MTTHEETNDQNHNVRTHSHDIQLQELLKAVLQAEEPPVSAMERMLEAQEFIDDAELADLSMDTADSELSVRGRGPRQVLYETQDLTFDIVIGEDRVRGQIVGHQPDQHQAIEMVGPGDLVQASVDELGEFGFDVRPNGPFYLRLAFRAPDRLDPQLVVVLR